jgi:DNA-binding NarL/FixJ family response regulator
MAQNKVVILQDNDLSIKALKGAISELDGFEVVGASTDGEKGIEIIKSVEPEFVILGIVLKNVDGFGVMESICKNEQKPKILVVSSFTSENVISRALSSGAVYYIAKPFKREIIKNRLLELSGKGEIKESAGIEKRKNTLDERISKIFIAVGIGNRSLLVVTVVGVYDSLVVCIGSLKKVTRVVILIIRYGIIRIGLGRHLTKSVVCISYGITSCIGVRLKKAVFVYKQLCRLIPYLF